MSDMDESKRARLKEKGWVETTVEEFLGLDEEDVQAIEERMRLHRESRKSDPPDLKPAPSPGEAPR